MLTLYEALQRVTPRVVLFLRLFGLRGQGT